MYKYFLIVRVNPCSHDLLSSVLFQLPRGHTALQAFWFQKLTKEGDDIHVYETQENRKCC